MVTSSVFIVVKFWLSFGVRVSSPLFYVANIQKIIIRSKFFCTFFENYFIDFQSVGKIFKKIAISPKNRGDFSEQICDFYTKLIY